MKNNKIIYNVTGIVFVIDQIIKIIISHTMKLHELIKVIPNFFSIYYVKNTGAAFSILKDSSILLVIISVAFILYINRYIIKSNVLNTKEQLIIGTIMGGVLGNLLDRIIHKGVIDYLSFTFFGYDFAIFNFADTCIVLGIIAYIILLFNKEKSK